MSSRFADNNGREYARLSTLHVGDKVQVDGDFEGCFEPWSVLEVVQTDGEFALLHNVLECGACGGSLEDSPCPHTLDGQLMDDNDHLIGIYHARP